MALSDPYATPAQYRMAVHKTDQDEEEELLADLTAISRIIEYELHTFFNKDDALVLRYYVPNFRPASNAWTASGVGWAESENPWRNLRGDPNLYIDPIADATGLQIHVDTNRDASFSTLLSASDYTLLPRNALVGPEPSPYKYLSYTNSGIWTPGCDVRINAIWGWPAVPKPIERACIHITSILRIESPRATSSIDQMGSAVAASKACQDILEKLKKPYMRNLL